MFKSIFNNILQQIQSLLRATPAYELYNVQSPYFFVRYLNKMLWNLVPSSATQTFSSQQQTDLRQHQH